MTSTAALAAFRHEFAACERYAYFMAAAVSPVSRSALDAMRAHTEAMAAHGGLRFEPGLRLWEECRDAFAALIGAETRQVAMVGSASLAYNLLASELRDEFSALRLQGDEFPSATLPWRSWGYRVQSIDAGAWEEAATADWGGLLSLPLVHFAHGRRTPVATLRALAAREDRYLLLNATQGLGQIPFSLQETPVDALVCTSHKWLLGHEGVCFLYLSDRLAARLARRFTGWRSVSNPMAMSSEASALHAPPRQYELGLASSTAAAATLAGLRLIGRTGVDVIWRQVQALRADLLARLAARGISPVGPGDPALGSGIVLLPCPEPQALKEALGRQDVLTTARGHGLRLALHGYNDARDLDRLTTALADCQHLLAAQPFA